MAGRTAVRRGLPSALVALLVVALAVGVVALSALALQRTQGVPVTDAARTVPTGMPSPTAAATRDAAVIAAPGDEERFLAVGDDVLWRATAGDCLGEPPLVERSTDAGIQWTDVTPEYRDVTQVRDLLPFSGTEADMVAAMGDDCETGLLRTFTQGSFWSPYDDLLPRFTYRDGDSIMIDGDAAEGPCMDPWSVRSAGDVTALICDGTVHEYDGDDWTEAESGVVALDVLDGEIVVATVSDACDGLELRDQSRDVDLGCIADADPADPAAVALTADEAWLWSGDELASVDR